MLSQLTRWGVLSPPPLSPVVSHSGNFNPVAHTAAGAGTLTASEQRKMRGLNASRGARRRLKYEEDEDIGDESEGYNKEIAMLEMYSQSARGEALIVHTVVDDQDVEVLIFKGFSSCLSQRTVTDPSRSVLPPRAVIKSIDRIRGPFDPSNIEFIQKGLSWDAFKALLPST